MLSYKTFFQTHVCPKMKTLVIVLAPLLLLPLIFNGAEARAGYCVLLMTIYWLTSALPEAVTSLLPIVLFPLLDILSTSEVCSLYIKQSNIVFFGGVVLALGVEKSNLHRRIALRVILTFGTNPRWLMLGFMSVSMSLSLWISNSGVTAMLIPIVNAVVDELFHDSKDVEMGAHCAASQHSSIITLQEAVQPTKPCNRPNDIKQKVKVPFLIAVSYAASIGGTGTLIGSGAPLAFKGIFEELYGSDTGLSFATWMAIGVPVALITTLLAWIWLQVLFASDFKSTGDDECGMRNKEDIKSSIRSQYTELGPMTYYEKSIMFLFGLLIVLWVSKDPQFMPGWEDLFHQENRIGDGTVAIAVVVLAFILPSEPNFWFFSKPGQESSSSPALLEWSYVQRKFPWSVLLLLGGGYAISDASKVSGLSVLLANYLSSLATLPPFAIMFIMCFLTSAITEIASNTAIASILLPIVAQISEVAKLNPLYLMMPVTFSCCHAFMLPVGTPSNAMVFSAGKMKPGDMMKAGAVMKIISICVLCAVMETVGVAIFGLGLSSCIEETV
ncbi:hypothetical protein GHT06_018951 [Daphnia sinensis]|uniref:Uncharacterized protein n=1 Tax=Daphnia sinensis TaxID=1820382 RepID=A0AAD5KN92_9CRUS|nr:hypothetical protein GHT06_018951 [Daphnia sinensis]